LLWPELLSEPINPIGWRTRLVKLLKTEGKRTLARLGQLFHSKTLHAKMGGH